MTDYVRIKDPDTGAEFTYDTAKVDALSLSEHVVDKPALGRDGLPAPTKPHVPLGEALPGSEQDRRNQEQPDRVPLVEPPRSGRGSGLGAWAAWAESLELEVPEGANRDDVIALVDAHTAETGDTTETPGDDTPGDDAGQPADEEN